ncbi:MAG: ERCC4 domain-containing protein [Candidatus Aenigmatarchaeota archaeon]
MREFQKIFKPSKVFIISDFREEEVIENFKKLGVAVNKQSLEIGDFVVSKQVVIERKTHNDFVSSIIDGRIFEQAYSMRKNFEKPILIVEGYSTREINENALMGAIATLLIDFNISILYTKNPLDTAKTIYWIAKKEQAEKKEEIGIRVGKKPKDIRKMQEFIVCSIPGVSTILGRRLLENFGSVYRIFTASEEELQKVKGIGKSLASKIKKILTANY